MDSSGRRIKPLKRLGKTGPEPHTQLKLGVNEREPELYGGVYSFTQNSEKTKALEDFCPAPNAEPLNHRTSNR
jgi:hypothetical protein